MDDPIRRRLLAYYDAHSRSLPWRETRDPYRIWVSEIMLQQTRVEAVRDRYDRFLARFPTVTALALAEAEQVCEEWAGLGYYSRARNLHRAARHIVARYGGQLPSDDEQLRALPGVGRYTAGAIRSIAFGCPVAAVDGNAERVLCRLHGLRDAAGRVREQRVQELASRLADCDRPGDVNQALMDLATQICRPRSPSCEQCPLAPFCRARAEASQDVLPLRKRPARRRLLRVAFAWAQRDEGTVLLEQRGLEGLWAGQWQLPGEEGPRARARLQARLGCRLATRGVVVNHSLTHRDVLATIYEVRDLVAVDLPRSRWYGDPDAAALSALARKAIAAFRHTGER